MSSIGELALARWIDASGYRAAGYAREVNP